MKPLKMLWRLWRKPAAAPKSTAGFTLIELLVALLIGSLIISSLLFVLVRFLDADRRERAKVATQEELQAALNFIADDLQEAVYIYNADGIERDSTQNPPGIRDQLPHVTNPSSDICPGPTGSPAARRCTPVLVFWKRNIYPSNEKLPANDPAERLAGCVEFSSTPSSPLKGCGNPPKGTDKFTYSLVAYYISRGQGTAPVRTARLLRWELKGGIPWSCAVNSSPTAFQDSDCPIAPGERVDRNGNPVNTPALAAPIVSALNPSLKDSTIYAMRPDPGFVSPTSTIASTFGTLGQRLNQWKRFANYNLSFTPYEVLVDFIDDTPYNPVQDDFNPSATPPNGSPNPNTVTAAGADVFDTGVRPNQDLAPPSLSGSLQRNQDCDNPDRGVGNVDPNLGLPNQAEFAQRVPSTFDPTISRSTIPGDRVNPSGLSSFYVCVNSSRNAVRVYLRGNAWARVVVGRDGIPVSRESRLPRANTESFFITQNVRAFGRGVLNVK